MRGIVKTTPNCRKCLGTIYSKVIDLSSLTADQKACSKLEIKDVLEKYPVSDTTCVPMCDILNQSIMERVYISHAKKPTPARIDPFYKLKKQSRAFSKKLADEIKPRTPEEMLRISLASNAIDLSHLTFEQATAKFHEILEIGPAIDETALVLGHIKRKPKLVFVSDNVGELYFDRFLLDYIFEEWEKEITVVVRSSYALNDNLLEDVNDAGLITDNIIQFKGLGFYQLVDDFENTAILAKGQAAYLTVPILNEHSLHVLNIKCRPIADSLGSKVGNSAIVML